MALRTPLAVEVLLGCYTGSIPNRGAPAVQETIEYLKTHGLIDRADFPHVTDKGEFMIEHLLNVPFPVNKWEIPNVLVEQ